MKSILYVVQLLETRTLSVKCATLIRTFILDGLILLTEVKILERTHLCYREVISVVITNCCRNGKKSRHCLRILYLEVGWENLIWYVWCHTRCLLW